MTIFTIGHSTRTLDELVGLLRAHGIGQLADVRSVPRSRRNPQFNHDTLAAALPAQGFVYRLFESLGGLRHPRRDSTNMGWQNESFRGYADYMETAKFREGLDDLVTFAATAPTAIMCAEAVWWRCHRRLVADALTVRGVDVEHILSRTTAERHSLTEFARVKGGVLSYPGLV